MFASNFIVKDTALKHVRGRELLSKFEQKRTIETQNYMANYFCSQCGKPSCDFDSSHSWWMADLF